MADQIGPLLRPGSGTPEGGPGVAAYALSPADAGTYWQNQPNFKSIDAALGYMQLGGFGAPSDDLSQFTMSRGGEQVNLGTTPGFLYLKPIVRPLNSAIEKPLGGSLQSGVPSGDKSYDLCEWEPLSGADWQTWLPDNSHHTRVIHATQTPDRAAEARTKAPLEADRQMRFDVQVFGRAAGATQGAAMRLMWGDGALSLIWREGASPTLERMRKSKWEPWYRLDGAPLFEAGAQLDWTIWVQRIAGRIVIRLENPTYSGKWDYLDTVQGVREEDIKLREVSWRRGRVGFRTFNVQASVGLSILDHAHTTGGKKKPLQATCKRDLPRPIATGTSSDTTAILIGKTAGWLPVGASTRVVMKTQSASSETRGRATVGWECTLIASPDGINSPAVASVFGYYDGAFSNPPPEFLGVRPAALRGSFSSAEPPQMCGSELRLDLSRNLLEDLTPDWERYLQPYHPIELAIRRRYDNGASPPTYSPWVGRFKGYQLDFSRRNSLVNERHLAVICESPAKRLQKPHSIIDHKYRPLDLLYAQSPRGRKLFSTQCVQEIIRVALGEAEAARLNGNGDAMRFLSPDHPPIINTLGDGLGLFPLSQPMAQGSPTFLPPWNTGPLDWIHTICGYDRTDFFYRFVAPDDDEGAQDGTGPVVAWPSPVCGRYEYIVANQPAHRMADALYIPGDEERAISSQESRVRADFVYNRFLSWANGGGDRIPQLPALFMAEESLAPGDPNSAMNSWERTLVMEDQFGKFGSPATVQAAAFLARREFEDKDWRQPTLSSRGQETLDWGDTVEPQRLNVAREGAQQSDLNIYPENTAFRVLRVEDNYDFEHAGTDQYMTTATCAMLSTGGF